MSSDQQDRLVIGWGRADITPEGPVMIAGQFHMRIAEGIRDPLTATALALETPGEAHCVLVSLDLVTISEELRDRVRQRAGELTAGLDPAAIVLNATHTHTGPDVRIASFGGANVPPIPLDGLDVVPVEAYLRVAVERIAQAIAAAWQSRAPGRIGWGLGHVVVGHNRRWCRQDGTSTMYGNTADERFSHIEGYEDHSLNLMATYGLDDRLTGLVINLACPSQVSENEWQISADYWHEVRTELRRRLGKDLAILPQCSAAGDQSPHNIWHKAAEQRMLELHGLNQRQKIGLDVANEVERLLPVLQRESPALTCCHELVPIPRRLLTREEVDRSLAEGAEVRARFNQLKAEIEADPARRQQPRWYREISAAYRRAHWLEAVGARYELQQRQPELPVEVHALRLGGLAMATNPFEYYLDFGMHIKARSPAVQTFLVQLAGSGTYLAPERSLSGGSYGAVPASTVIGPEGGWALAKRTVEILNRLG